LEIRFAGDLEERIVLRTDFGAPDFGRGAGPVCGAPLIDVVQGRVRALSTDGDIVINAVVVDFVEQGECVLMRMAVAVQRKAACRS